MAAFAQYGSLVLKESGAISFGVILIAYAVQTLLKLLALAREKRI